MATVTIGTREIDGAARRFEGRPVEALAWAAERFPKRVTFSTGFGAEGCLIIHLIARHQLAIDVFTLDTGLLFPETYALWRRLEERYGITIRAVRPAPTVAEQAADPRRGAVGARPRPLLRAPQDRAARARRSRAWTPGSPPSAATRRPERASAQRRRAGRALRPRQGQPARALDARRRLALPARARRPVQPAPRPGLPEHRLPAVHERRRRRRGPARRPLARTPEDRMRPARRPQSSFVPLRPRAPRRSLEPCQ